jgi:two-component system invasion response regulator UvrY
VNAAPVRVMLVDDHAVVRMGFKLLLESSGDLRVIAEAESGEDALRAYAEVSPDVLVLDISMPGIGGLETVTRLLSKFPEARILVLSAHEDTLHARRALKAGALGYLSKRSAAEELMQAIRQVHRRKTYIEPALAQQMAIQEVSGERNPVEVLSDKEFKVFLALARGESVAEIAQVMHLSPRTVGTHLYNIKQKLGAGNQAEITLIAMRSGLLEP